MNETRIIIELVTIRACNLLPDEAKESWGKETRNSTTRELFRRMEVQFRQPPRVLA